MNTLNFIKHKFKPQKFKKHFHTNYSIGLITQGVHKLNIKNQDLVITAKDIKIINPFEMHIADGAFAWEYINFMPEKEIIDLIYQEIFEKEPKKVVEFQNSIRDKEANRLFLKLYRSKGKFEKEENFTIFISHLLKNFLKDRASLPKISSPIKSSIEFIRESFLKDISLEEVAKVSRVSKYHLIKLFSKEIGLTPYQYILDLRLEYGFRLIKLGYPLSLVAFEAKFSDQSHFIKAFKARYGFTPSLLK